MISARCEALFFDQLGAHFEDHAKPFRVGGSRARMVAAKTSFCTSKAESIMGFSSTDIVPLSVARAQLSDLADHVKAGAEEIITKNGESYVALVDASRLDYYHQLERERIHLLLIEDAKRGLADIDAGRTEAADAAIAKLQLRRAQRATSKTEKKRG